MLGTLNIPRSDNLLGITDDNMEREEGVSDIEQFSTSEDSDVSPSQCKRGAMPEAHVKKKSRTEDPPHRHIQVSYNQCPGSQF